MIRGYEHRQDENGLNIKDLGEDASPHEITQKVTEGLKISDCVRDVDCWKAVSSDERLQELQRWVSLSSADCEQLHRRRDGEAVAGRDSEFIAAVVQDSVLEEDEERERKRRSRARKWLREYISDYEDDKEEMLRKDNVKLNRIHETITYVLWYLGQGRLDFGLAGLDWVQGIILELKKLENLHAESFQLIRLQSVQVCLVIVHRMCEHGLQEEIRPLEEFLRDSAQQMYRSCFDGGSKLLERTQRLALFNVLNNFACLEIERAATARTEGKSLVQQAARLLRDDDPGAETFLLNAGSLMMLNTGQKEAEGIMLRALQIAQQKLDARQQVSDDVSLRFTQVSNNTLFNSFLCIQVPESEHNQQHDVVSRC